MKRIKFMLWVVCGLAVLSLTMGPAWADDNPEAYVQKKMRVTWKNTAAWQRACAANPAYAKVLGYVTAGQVRPVNLYPWTLAAGYAPCPPTADPNEPCHTTPAGYKKCPSYYSGYYNGYYVRYRPMPVVPLEWISEVQPN